MQYRRMRISALDSIPRRAPDPTIHHCSVYITDRLTEHLRHPQYAIRFPSRYHNGAVMKSSSLQISSNRRLCI